VSLISKADDLQPKLTSLNMFFSAIHEADCPTDNRINTQEFLMFHGLPISIH
jgi:hypothetical protein